MVGSTGVAGICAFTTAVGFVAGGLLESGYRLFTNRPLRLMPGEAQGAARMAAAAMLVFAGPAVLMGDALRGRVARSRPGAGLALAVLICATWSFMSGLFILNVVIALR